jgi:hypothetical protein
MIKDCQDFPLILEPGPNVKIPRQELLTGHYENLSDFLTKF